MKTIAISAARKRSHPDTSAMCFKCPLAFLSILLTICLWAIASAEKRPCLVLAFRILSKPSGVLGPVNFPPCNLYTVRFSWPGLGKGSPARSLPHIGGPW